MLKAVFFTADEDADLNGDGIVNIIDMGIMKLMFFRAPGPAGNPTGTTYLHRDYQGSIVALTDDSGDVVERRAYDAWGGRRALEGGNIDNTMDYTPRGYTGHEHLPHLGLIHMNGRVYDPEIGRFISPDPYIPDPTDMQSFNPYSYVRNNPFNRVDPSGFVDAPLGDDVNPLTIDINQPATDDFELCIFNCDTFFPVFGAGSVPLTNTARDERDRDRREDNLEYCAATGLCSGGGSAIPSRSTTPSLGNVAVSIRHVAPLAANTGSSGSVVHLGAPGDSRHLLAALNPGGSRSLTAGETALARSVFGDDIDYSKVRIHRKKYWVFQPKNIAMAPNGNIYFHPKSTGYSDDFANEHILLQGFFIHEMTHVWQHQNGINVRLRGIFQRRYNYEFEIGKPLSKYKLEQQGNVVSDYFFLLNEKGGGPALELYREILPFACIASGEC